VSGTPVEEAAKGIGANSEILANFLEIGRNLKRIVFKTSASKISTPIKSQFIL